MFRYTRGPSPQLTLFPPPHPLGGIRRLLACFPIPSSSLEVDKSSVAPLRLSVYPRQCRPLSGMRVAFSMRAVVLSMHGYPPFNPPSLSAPPSVHGGRSPGLQRLLRPRHRGARDGAAVALEGRGLLVWRALSCAQRKVPAFFQGAASLCHHLPCHARRALRGRSSLELRTLRGAL